MNNITTPSILLFSAAPKSGKSYFIKYLLYGFSRTRRFNHGLVFSNTAFNGFYDFIPAKYRSATWDEARLERFMDLQGKLVAQGKGVEAFVVLDDILGSAKQLNSAIFTKLCTQYRHYKITVFIATQYIYKIPPVLRECANYVLIFKQASAKSFKALHESVGQLFDKDKDFKRMIQQATGANDHSVLMYQLEAPEEVSKKFSIVKASKVPDDFKLDF